LNGYDSMKAGRAARATPPADAESMTPILAAGKTRANRSRNNIKKAIELDAA
jgi:hypothetical protein